MKKNTNFICVLLSVVMFMSSCASFTVIQSTPKGADVYINSEKKGITPYYHSDTKIVGSTTKITLKKTDYQDLNVTLSRNERVNVGAIIGGCFVLFPFLWIMSYDENHCYTLAPLQEQKMTTSPPSAISSSNSNSTNELIKLKGLLDQGAITTDDFTTLKVKILNDKYDYNNSIADQLYKLSGLLDATLLTKEEYNSQKLKLINGN